MHKAEKTNEDIYKATVNLKIFIQSFHCHNMVTLF